MPRHASFDFAILDIVLERPMRQFFPMIDASAEPVPMSITERLEALKLVFDQKGHDQSASSCVR